MPAPAASAVPSREEVGATATRSSPAIDLAPPTTPNLVRRPELADARRVGRNALETILFRGVSTPTALLFVVLQSRLLEPAGRGEFVVVVLGATIVSRLLGQLGVAVTSERARSPLPVRDLTHRALVLGTALAAAGAPIMVAISVLSGQVGVGAAAIGAAGILPNVVWQTISGVLLGEARLRLWNVIQLLAPVLSLVALLILVAGLDTGVEGALAGWSAAQALTACFALVAARDLWSPLALPSLADAASRAIARLALVMGAVQIVNLVSYRAEVFVLGRETGNAGVGVYSIAFQAVESMWLVPAAIATAVTAPVVTTPVERDAARLVARSSVRALALAAVVAAAVGAGAPWLIPAVFGEDFEGAVTPLALLLPGVVAYAPVTVLVVYLSVRRARPWLSLGVSAVAGVVTVAAAVLLVPRFAASGAAVASTLGYVAGAALAWGFFFMLTRRPSRRV